LMKDLTAEVLCSPARRVVHTIHRPAGSRSRLPLRRQVSLRSNLLRLLPGAFCDDFYKS
jgi:hypothetical protein